MSPSPTPAVAASALGALGYFANDPDYGTGFYAALRKSGAEQVDTPDDVVTGVAEGTYDAGITIANSAYAAKENGSPIEVTWPEPGAVAIYGPVALAKDTRERGGCQELHLLRRQQGRPGAASRKSGSYPTLTGVAGPTKPEGAPVVFPDWAELSADKDALLAKYQKIFGG